MKQLAKILTGITYVRLIFIYKEGTVIPLERFSAQKDSALLDRHRRHRLALDEQRASLPLEKQEAYVRINGRDDTTGIADILHELDFVLVRVCDTQEKRGPECTVHETVFTFVLEGETSFRNESARVEQLALLTERMEWRYQFRSMLNGAGARMYLTKPRQL